MCEYRCSGPSRLPLNMGAKHGINGELFYCDPYITSINNHKSWKHDGEVYSCSYCDLTTMFKQFLQNHIDNKHLGIKVNCAECDYAGASAQCLTPTRIFNTWVLSILVTSMITELHNKDLCTFIRKLNMNKYAILVHFVISLLHSKEI